jgi:hypothetical protein
MEAANSALGVASRGFLPGDDLPWVEDRRRELEELRLRTLEAVAAAGAALGGPQLAAAERAARNLVEAAPFRESGHRLLMEALAARGDVAEALRAYDKLRILLRDELGTAPAAPLQTLHRRLLAGVEPPAAAAPAPPAPELRAGREERKLVTVVCAELALGARSYDPEQLRAVLADAHDRLRETMERFGGTLRDPAPGPALAFFGAAVAHEDDAERAVKAALEACGRRLARRAAVATGEAIVAGGGRAATGPVVTTALELLSAAPQAAVAVDEPTESITRGTVSYGSDDGVRLARAVRGERPPVTAIAPLVGRAREIAALEALYGTVVEERRPRLVTIVGQAGIGKTRLSDELALRVEAHGATVHRGRCLAYGEGITYWALREILWDAAGIALDDSGAAASRKLGRLAEELDLGRRATAALAVSAGISMLGGELERASPEAVAEEIGLAWPGLLSGLAARSPVLIIVEDLHWAEAPLLEMLERIVARSSGPLVLVATARPEFAEAHRGWRYGAGMSQIGLEPLGAAHAREFVEQLLPDAGPALRERVLRLAEGNPFFAQEIARHLGADTEPAAAIPHTVRALLAARIDALPEAEKSALQHAAVVGRRFWLSALEPNETGVPLPPLLRSLENRGLVVSRPVSSLPGERELWFAHGLTREVAYQSIPRGPRSRTHAAVGAWLERLAGDRRGEFIDLLAYHWEAAADPAGAELAWPADYAARERIRSQAAATLIAAGRAARQRFQTEQALRYAGRALALAGSDAERLAALQLRASTLHEAVRADEALSTYLEAFALARAIGASEAASDLRAGATLLCARYTGAFSGHDWQNAVIELIEQGLEELGEDSVTFETGALLVGRVWARRWAELPAHDRRAARSDALKVIEIAKAIDSPYLHAVALHSLYKVVIQDGLCECAGVGEQLLAATERISDPVEAHEGLVVASTALLWGGRFEAAREVADRAVAEAARLSPHRRLHAICVHAAGLGAAGRIAELLQATREVPGLVREEGARTCPYGALALARHANALFEAGETSAAASAAALLNEVAPRERATAFLFAAAEILRPFVGSDSTRRNLERIEGSPLDAADASSRLRVELQLGALAAREELLDPLVGEARALASSACAPFLDWIADWAEAVRLARAGAGGEALARGRAACAALDCYGERYTAARLLVDLLALLDGELGGESAAEVAERLEAMGAIASAAEARVGLRRPSVSRKRRGRLTPSPSR